MLLLLLLLLLLVVVVVVAAVDRNHVSQRKGSSNNVRTNIEKVGF